MLVVFVVENFENLPQGRVSDRELVRHVGPVFPDGSSARIDQGERDLLSRCGRVWRRVSHLADRDRATYAVKIRENVCTYDRQVFLSLLYCVVRTWLAS